MENNFYDETMDMPTPCLICDEIFDLNDGKGGLTHDTSDKTICITCYENQEEQKKRVDIIREALEKIEDNESQIETYRENLSEIKEGIRDCENELEDLQDELDENNYGGDNDDYHTLIEKFY